LPKGTTPTPGRNEPCHCGSGRKYKQCHLEKDEVARRKARAKEQGEGGDAGAAAASADVPKPAPPPRQQTQQPWKGPRNTKGFQKLTTPRRSGGS
jgi:SEC-C motif-containing protein